jgi:2-dehydropantoate 2-reductase
MKTKLLIVGIGGVGGYYGGLLAKKYVNDPTVEIYFLARGEHLKKMQKNGLTLITENETHTIHPTLATDDISQIGVVDYILLATKCYDLETTIEQIASCVGKNTVLLPLLNGIDNSTRIQKILPHHEIWYGSVYIVTRLIAPGIVQSTGNIHGFSFGADNVNDTRLRFMQTLLIDAGIEAVLSENIIEVVWRKFFFISPTASLTSFYDVSFGALITTQERKITLVAMLKELLSISRAEKLRIEDEIVEKIIHRLEVLPYETTSSMHSDFKAKRNTELYTLTGIVVELGKKHNLPTPTYAKIYEALRKRTELF